MNRLHIILLVAVFAAGPVLAMQQSKKSAPFLFAQPPVHDCIGQAGFCPEFGSQMAQQYGYPEDIHRENASSMPDTIKNFVRSGAGFGWFPDLDSRHFDPAFDQKPVSAAEQILYSLGMIALQMTALELDRSINTYSTNLPGR